MSKVKFLIIGRSGVGKDYLKDLLTSEFSWNFVKSMTTRLPRFDGEDTHVFLTKEEASEYIDRVAETTINDNVYFATREQVDNCDGYIIDPDGVNVLLKNMPDTWFEIIYIKAPNYDQRKEAAINRGDATVEAATFNDREASEDTQFRDFEDIIENGTFDYDNCHGITVIENDYTEDTMLTHAVALNLRKSFYANVRDVILTLAKDELLDVKEDKYISIHHQSSEEPVTMSIERYIQILAEEPKTTFFSSMMQMYMWRK